MFAFLFYSKVLFTKFRFSSSNFTESIFWKFITICRHFTCLIKNGIQLNLYRLLEFRTKRAKMQNFTDLLMIFSALLQLSVCLFELKCKGFFLVKKYIVSYCDIISNEKQSKHQIISQQKLNGYLVHKS